MSLLTIITRYVGCYMLLMAVYNDKFVYSNSLRAKYAITAV